MTTAYPGAIDSLTNPTPSDTLNSATVPHAAQHANLNDAMEAVQTVLGTNPQGTSSTVKDRIAAAEGALINLGQDLDTRVPGETGSNAPSGTLPNGYVWVNTTDNSLKVWNGTTWVDPSNAGSGGPTWAVVSGGTVTEYTHPTYGVMEVHTFLANASLVVSSAGLAEVFAISGGGYGSGSFTGAGGRVKDGLWQMPAGTLPITVGVGASGLLGGASAVGSVISTGVSPAWYGGAGGTSTNAGTGPADTGYTTSVSGSPVEYGRGNVASPTPNRGDGASASGAPGSSGIVIVVVKKP